MELIDEITVAALELARAGRGETALRLLDASGPDDPRIALTAAEVAVEHDMRTGSREAPARVAAAEKICGRTWDVEFAALRLDYFDQVFSRSTSGDDLRPWASRLIGSAPDPVRAGWAHMWLGLILDNLAGDRPAAPAHYRVALSAGDDLLTWEALRHLGDHDRDDGDLDRARERWERAAALGAATGRVGGTLAQQMLLAVLHRDTGDEAGAVALAREISRWAHAIGAVRQHRQAEAFLAGERIA
ncbi:hypothetical protein KOI35_36950 [Actinoplanes bogorensis]|uniref:Sel1 repeat family protein n=1 Tax=Paractinoplanes bogorensis TaxID=1610840 RepID=A0ABS5Z0C2_9ACTN|nr:hypothetical protein [Actinoplanes bogorensis]MBU2669117.1 hypothetical protein [Actinoplanes bogorensis]